MHPQEANEADFHWLPEGVTRVPYQVFTDPAVYAREQERMKLSQNSKNAKKRAIFMVEKGRLLTKFIARYVGGHATQVVSLRCHRCPMGPDQTLGLQARSHGPPP